MTKKQEYKKAIEIVKRYLDENKDHADSVFRVACIPVIDAISDYNDSDTPTDTAIRYAARVISRFLGVRP